MTFSIAVRCGKKLKVLEDHAGLATDLLELRKGDLAARREVDPVRADLHPAGCRLLQKVDGAQQRAFATAGGADERRHTALGN